MNLLALDASTTALGWVQARVEGMTFEVVGHGTFRPEGPWWQRTCWIGDYVENLVTSLGWQADVVAYEVPTGNRGNMVTHRRMGAAEYAVVLAAHYHTEHVWGINAGAVAAEDVSKHGQYADVLFAELAGDAAGSEDELDAMAVAMVAHRRWIDEVWTKEGNDEG